MYKVAFYNIHEEVDLCEASTVLVAVECRIDPLLPFQLPQGSREILQDSIAQSVVCAFSEGELDGIKSITGQVPKGFDSRITFNQLKSSSWWPEISPYVLSSEGESIITATIRAMKQAYLHGRSLYNRKQDYASPITVGDAMVYGQIG
jgi:hypothetical protein